MASAQQTNGNATSNKKPLEVRCPSCGEMHIYSTDNPYRPFCSKGCKAIDLGAWASEQYRMESKPSAEDLLDEPGA